MPLQITLDTIEPLSLAINCDGTNIRLRFQYNVRSSQHPDISIGRSVDRPANAQQRQALLDLFAAAVTAATNAEGI